MTGIKNKALLNNGIFIIAEIGQAHEGSLGIAHSYIDALADTGVDAIKWQTHIAEAESSSKEQFRVNFSYEDQSRMDYWRRMEFTPEQWRGLKQHCEEKGMEFVSSPFSLASVQLLEDLEVKRYKIGSGEISNFLMLDKIASTGKPIILSSGMSSFVELEKTLEFLKPYGNELSLLQCTTAYPTKPEEWGLNVIDELSEKFGLPVGFSDHSGEIYACLAAVARGAEILEFHAVFDKRMFGPDARASLEIDEVKQLVKGVRQITTSLKNPLDKNDNSRFTDLKQIFEKSLAVNTDLLSGTIIEAGHLETKKPRNQGVDASEYQKVIGKKLIRDLKKWEFINYEDLN